jgi:RNA-binding protein Musashi
MESDLGKLFIGGISWDTDEERLREYFATYGEVIEAVIMRDRATGRARGFGFVVFADPAVAERVIIDKHIIDGRTVSCFICIDRSIYTRHFVHIVCFVLLQLKLAKIVFLR